MGYPIGEPTIFATGTYIVIDDSVIASITKPSELLRLSITVAPHTMPLRSCGRISKRRRKPTQHTSDLPTTTCSMPVFLTCSGCRHYLLSLESHTASPAGYPLGSRSRSAEGHDSWKRAPWVRYTASPAQMWASSRGASMAFQLPTGNRRGMDWKVEKPVSL